jgi:3-hydroxyacyl-CoA dehydrogenase/enoyl-CoA hydratase/3-hydroxybutyryl-CoA epimerase
MLKFVGDETMNLVNFRFETGADGVALATWDMPERSMNVITPEVMDELEKIIDTVVAEPNVKGCVIASGKSAFSGGADLSMLQHGAAQYAKALKEHGEEAANKQFFEFSRRLSLLYRTLSRDGR